MSKRELQVKIIDWVINDATEQQLDGLIELLVVGDTMYGLELIFGKQDFQEWFEELKKEIKEDN